MVQQQDAQMVVRISTGLLERADKLAEVLRGRPEFGQVRISRGAVLRMAIAEGLDALEARYATKLKKK